MFAWGGEREGKGREEEWGQTLSLPISSSHTYNNRYDYLFLMAVPHFFALLQFQKQDLFSTCLELLLHTISSPSYHTPPPIHAL